MNIQATLIERTLDNGMKIIVRENPLTTDVVCQLNYKVSYRNESVENTGITAALIDTLLKDNFGKSPKVETENGSRAWLFDDFISYIQAISPDRLDQAFERYGKVMNSPVLTEESLNQAVERAKNLRDKNRFFTSDYDTPAEFKALTYPVSGYGNPQYPTPVSAAQIDLIQLQQWYQRFYSPDNATLIIVGNVNAEEVVRLAEQRFGAVPSRSTERTPDRQELHEPGRRHVVLHKDTKLPRLLVGFNLPGTIDTQYRKTVPTLEVLAAIIDQNITARLAVCGGKCFYTPLRYASLIRVSLTAMTCDQSLEGLEVELNKWLESLKTEVLSTGELDAARQQILDRWKSPQDQNNRLAYIFSHQEVNQLPLAELDQKHQELMDVTLADIQCAASTYFIPERMTVAHILPMQAPAH